MKEWKKERRNDEKERGLSVNISDNTLELEAASQNPMGQKPRDPYVSFTDAGDFELVTFIVVFTHPWRY